MIELGDRIKSLRIKCQMTQAQLSRKIGVTKSMVSAYENGIRLPSYDVLISIAKVFNVTTDYLLGLNKKDTVDLSGLSDEQIEAIVKIINVMKKY